MSTTYYNRFMLEDLDDNTITLKLPRRKIFRLGKVAMYYDWETESAPFLSMYIEETDTKAAKAEINTIIGFLSYLYGYDLIASNHVMLWKREIPKDMEEIALNTTNNNLQNIFVFYNALNNLEDVERKIVNQSIAYYAKALRLMDFRLYDEAFLVGYKSMEIIFNHLFSIHYNKQFEEDIKNIVKELIKKHFDEDYKGQNKDLGIQKSIFKELKELITARRKAVNSLRFLGLDKYNNQLGKVVQARNSVGAHASGTDTTIDNHLIDESLSLAFKVISRMVIRDNDDIALAVSGEKKF
ncbi:hypothetical protein COC45_28160 [Bacillus cereus]|nr:hypothetical protein COC45_28160 [Bacillus cereus]